MCGIAGVALLNNRGEKSVLEQKIKVMNNLMKHRGPDGDGVFSDGVVGLGNRRLSIIDLSERGRQPMANKEKNLHIVFNGEIYNYEDIRKELSVWYEFQGNSDTEVVLYAYARWGEKCLEKLRGMFAFCIYDVVKKHLFLARDHLGQKPLIFYSDQKNREFYFASEIKPILEASHIKPKINLKALHLYFLRNYRHIPDPYTIYEDVFRLPPATYLFFNVQTGEYSINFYWKPTFIKDNSLQEKDYIERYKTLIQEAVNLTTVADVPVGTLLSGGIDSSTIVALLKRKDIQTYSIGFSNNDEELKRSRLVARLFKTQHKEIILSHLDHLKVVERLVDYLGEPLNLLPAVHSYAIIEAARKDLKVLIGGNGADELFYGYDGSNRLAMMSNFINFPFIKYFLWPFLPGGSVDSNEIKGNLYRRAGRVYKQELYNDFFRQAIDGFDDGAIVNHYIQECDSKEYIEKSYWAGLMSENQHSVTLIGDLTGMANSVEVRAPFLDHKVVEFAAALPVQYKVGSWFDKKYNKYIMKRSMEGILPSEILWASKKGLGYHMDLSLLIRTQWKDYVLKNLKDALPSLRLFNMDKIIEQFNDHVGGKRNHGALLWGMNMLAIWAKKYFV